MVSHVSSSPLRAVLASWRNPRVRAVGYQAAVVLLLFWATFNIVQNTRQNLITRGIDAGFGFLGIEAGFGIAEPVPLPLLEGGFRTFLLVVALGLAGTYALGRWAAMRHMRLRDDDRFVLAVLALLVLAPITVLHLRSIPTVQYTEASSYGMAMLTGVANTLKVSAVGCVLATFVGLFVGIARLSSNWLVSKLAEVYVEVLRNIPPLVQLFFWYVAVLAALPHPRESWDLLGFLTLNRRGVYVPEPLPEAYAGLFADAIVLALVLIYMWRRFAKRYQDRTGEQLPVLWPALGVLVALPGLVWLLFGAPFTLEYPSLQGFNFEGGLTLSPEYTALLLGLTLYTASFIAEIVRSGIQSVSKGQREAAAALGLRANHTMRLVILPQALRVIVPPLTSQYMNLTKNSSLAVAIGYPEIVSVGGTTLNQTGQAIEVIALTMLVYLTFSLLISLGMNWYNTRVRLVER